MRTALVISLIAVFSVACGKEDKKTEKVEAPAGAGDNAPAAVPDKAPDKAPVAKPADDGWTRYENAENGFSVLVPAGTKPEEMDLDKTADGMVGKGYQFMLSADALGQLMYLRYDGPEEYDIEKGLDGAVNGAVGAMSSKMTDFQKTKIGGHPARTFSFEGSAQGYSFLGSGVAVGSGPKEIKAAMTLYQKGSTTSPAKGKKFVESFQVK